MSTTFTALAYNLTFLREQGVLKRMRGTPLPSGSYLLRARRQRRHERGDPDRDRHRRRPRVLRPRLAARLGRAGRVRRRRRDLLRLARRRALARDPELRVRAGVRQRRVRAGDPHLRRVLRRQAGPGLPPRHRPGAAAQAPDRRALRGDGQGHVARRQHQRARRDRRVGGARDRARDPRLQLGAAASPDRIRRRSRAGNDPRRPIVAGPDDEFARRLAPGVYLELGQGRVAPFLS